MPDIVVIGGRSRLAASLRHHLPGTTVYMIRSDPRVSDEIRVADYREAELDNAACVIHCVGTPHGSDLELDAVNHRLCFDLAVRARDAKVRRFIRISSFSVYGASERIGSKTAVAPTGSYGRSMAAGDESLLSLDSPAFSVTSIRLPALISADSDSKLRQLVRLTSKTGWMLSPATDVRRSMIGYDQAALIIAGLIADNADKICLAADPVPFSYRLLRDCFIKGGRNKVRTLALPKQFPALLSAVRPELARSLFGSSHLDDEDNRFMSLPLDSSMCAIVNELIAKES